MSTPTCAYQDFLTCLDCFPKRPKHTGPVIRIQGVDMISKESLLSETQPTGVTGCAAFSLAHQEPGPRCESLIRSTSAGGYTPASGEMKKGDRERCAKMA